MEKLLSRKKNRQIDSLEFSFTFTKSQEVTEWKLRKFSHTFLAKIS